MFFQLWEYALGGRTASWRIMEIPNIDYWEVDCLSTRVGNHAVVKKDGQKKGNKPRDDSISILSLNLQDWLCKSFKNILP